MDMHRGTRHVVTTCLGVVALGLMSCGTPGMSASDRSTALSRAKIYLAAADYRRAIETCQLELAERPSAASYVYLTYVYQALDAYVDSLAKADRWVLVEQLARSLSSQRPDELLEAPDILARIAKELIQDAAKRQADVAAGMATRLDGGQVAKLWDEQKRWRERRPDGWWLGVPPEWGW
jgi:hypothetical protein